ncbi:hypothetical protein BDR04DRAFT_1227185 [Suillus decipiens]|nr:hypothetical protein BDR04DRAFT_1227185 [Suillus decipiens]
MIVPSRPQHPPPISHTTELALHHFSLSSTPVSPPSTPPRGHRPSISKPMIWLTRNTSSSSNTSPHGVAAAPIRISEPKFDSSLEIFNIKRSGPLGSGATVVRTPQEALSGTSAQFDDEDDSEQRGSAFEEAMGLPTRSGSPPPVPPKSSLESSTLTTSTSTHTSSSSSLPVKDTSVPPCPTRPPPPAPMASSTILRPVIKAKTSPSLAENLPPVPPLPVNVSATPPQPPFEPILLSPVPSSTIDPSKIIVTIETSSATHRTTLRTLISRPSYLSNYVTSLLPQKSVAASLYSNASDISELPDNFNAMFHDHLASSGCISQSTMNIHVFLDRPSAPYAHILTYLRTPLFISEHPTIIPRAVQLASSSRARLEALLELRDEANYLGLDELFKLCNDEICNKRITAIHARAGSMSSSASIHSLHTVQEGGGPHDVYRSSSRSSGKSTRAAPSTTAAPIERSQDREENRANTPNSRRPAITSWI